MATYCVGLTGGIASGKTTVSELFNACGAALVDADVIARDVVARGTPGLAAVVHTFGKTVLNDAGELDRHAMRERVFSDADARRALEAIVHPLVRTRVLDACNAATAAYVVAAIPLLIEGGGRAAYPWFDRIIVVDVEPAVQIARLVARDGIDTDLAQRMLDAQASRSQRLAVADDLLVNDASLEALRANVVALDRRYRKLAVMKVGMLA